MIGNGGENIKRLRSEVCFDFCFTVSGFVEFMMCRLFLLAFNLAVYFGSLFIHFHVKATNVTKMSLCKVNY